MFGKLKNDLSLFFAEGLERLSGQFSISAVSGTLIPGAGLLTSIGDNAANSISFSRNAAGQILLNGGAVPVFGGTPTVANINLIQAFGLGGNDNIAIDEANGALPRANLFGGSGNDTLTGGSGIDQLFGQAGNDVLLGRGGGDFLFGGSENDTLTGGDGDDQMFGESGDDRMIWNPGDDNDLMEGGSGIDTAEVNGGGGAEQFTVTANGARVRFDRLNPAPFSLDIGTTEKLVVNMGGGNDSFSATGNLAALIAITVDGGAGDDTILGSNGADTLIGGDGNDFVDGQQGNDIGLLGAGNDVFQWDPGDGSDVVEGQAGIDTMLFNGSAGSEIFEASANGGRVLFTRNLGNIVMDLHDVEMIDLKALGGADTLTINDLSGTDVNEVKVDLAGAIGGTTGDGQADTVVTRGTGGADFVDLLGGGTGVAVLGLPAFVSVANVEGANDTLVVEGRGGDDRISAASLNAGIVKLVLDGGAGDDELSGSRGADLLIGGDGDDFVDGEQGDDIAFLGAGNDIFRWDPGDGSDVVEGQAGRDVMLFNGSGASENMAIVANGARVRMTRDVGNIVMDLDDVEKIDILAQGGADTLIIGDLSGTDLTEIAINLGAVLGSPQTDGAADSVTVNGTQGSDLIVVSGAAGSATVQVDGLQADITLTRAEASLDRLTVNGLGGDDVIDASSLDAGVIGLTLNGGLGADVFLGSDGNDLINGGDGDDVALMGAGDDVFVWNPGDDNDVLEGQAGTDTMLFNGANVAETINITANGGRVLFTRNIANVVMDLNDVETIDFNALGGADLINIGDLTGTDAAEINLNLGGADGQADTVVIDGTSGDDVAIVFGDGGNVTVLGLAVQLNITGFEAANDRLVIRGLGGDDVIEASGVAAGSVQLTLDGGGGDDVLIGGSGNDILLGGEGDDVLLGGGGLDVLDGGPGDNVVIQGLVAFTDAALLRTELMIA